VKAGVSRGRSIAMSEREVDDFLVAERTCRVASIDFNGRPDITPLSDGLEPIEAAFAQRYTRAGRSSPTAGTPRCG
jgi:hypothetical protein